MLSFDNVWGIEREKTSEFFGEIVVPTIALWDKPGGVYAGEDGFELTGALTHGAECFVVGEATVNDFNWSKVEADVWHEGQIYPQVGWLRDSLLKEKGAVEYAND